MKMFQLFFFSIFANSNKYWKICFIVFLKKDKTRHTSFIASKAVSYITYILHSIGRYMPYLTPFIAMLPYHVEIEIYSFTFSTTLLKYSQSISAIICCRSSRTKTFTNFYWQFFILFFSIFQSYYPVQNFHFIIYISMMCYTENNWYIHNISFNIYTYYIFHIALLHSWRIYLEFVVLSFLLHFSSSRCCCLLNWKTKNGKTKFQLK